uniref:Uncharacterized protein AlNc14C237G9416 n=1 Tax=Albugo laibachii Nc14 TaxID=890382 RepID=F0WF08_9STRA|nr:conserved hypothetical protein [Albugo laibachii Nc14]CCA24398.1 conserved hypothetical protein [Albugo laibachii Nc14]|eukprot:CCA24398.1 conserved hypothetical protein [Albugo laibachii Nc14]
MGSVTDVDPQHFLYSNESPSVNTLKVTNLSTHKILVTTNRNVSLLSYRNGKYALDRIPFDVESGSDFEVIDAVTVSTKSTVYVAIASIEFPSEQINLQTRCLSLIDCGEGVPCESVGNIGSKLFNRFHLETAPSTMVEIKVSTVDQLFTGVLVFTTEDVVAFGSITSQNEDESKNECEFAQLTSDQLYAFLPELKSLRHPIVTTEFRYVPESGYALGAFGCADGAVFIMRFQLMRAHELKSSNVIHDVHVCGPISCVRLWRRPQSEQWNLLVTSSVGYALVFKNIESEQTSAHILPEVGMTDSIFTALLMDTNPDRSEFFIGTGDQGLVACGHEAYMKIAEYDADRHSDEETNIDTGSTRVYFEAAGSVYSLASADLNGDGVDEVVVACSVAIYILKMDHDDQRKNHLEADSGLATELHNNTRFPVEKILHASQSNASE